MLAHSAPRSGGPTGLRPSGSAAGRRETENRRSTSTPRRGPTLPRGALPKVTVTSEHEPDCAADREDREHPDMYQRRHDRDQQPPAQVEADHQARPRLGRARWCDTGGSGRVRFRDASRSWRGLPWSSSSGRVQVSGWASTSCWYRSLGGLGRSLRLGCWLVKGWVGDLVDSGGATSGRTPRQSGGGFAGLGRLMAGGPRDAHSGTGAVPVVPQRFTSRDQGKARAVALVAAMGVRAATVDGVPIPGHQSVPWLLAAWWMAARASVSVQ